MRVLSFIPALLLAATSFVAAAPTGTSSLPVPSCTSTATSGSGNDAPLQPVIAILTNATTVLTPFNTQLTNMQGTNPDVDTVSGIIVQITAVVAFAVVQVKAAVSVQLDGLDLSTLCATNYALMTLVLSILNSVVLIVTALGGTAIISLQGVLTSLLNTVVDLVGCLQVFVTTSTSGILQPVLVFVQGAVTLLLSICAGVTVLVGVSS